MQQLGHVRTAQDSHKTFGQDYEELSNTCWKSGRLFEDDKFSLSSRLPGIEREVRWMRPKVSFILSCAT